MVRWLFITALLGGAGVWLAHNVMEATLPRFQPSTRPTVRGAFHVHSEASHDSTLKLETIAAAAAEQGMGFVVLTDHNNQLAGPVSLKGVHLLSSAELSTPLGHVIQLGAPDVLDEASRQRSDVLQSIDAIGGLSIIAHPADRKRPWEGPTEGASGLEIVNLASSIRRVGGPVFVGLLPALSVWKIRPQLALAQVYDRDDRALARWDGESDPSVAGLCAVDAHGRFDLALTLGAWQVVLEQPSIHSPGDAPGEAEGAVEGILRRLGEGRFHCVAGVVGAQARFRFVAQGEEATWGVGDSVPVTSVLRFAVEGPRPVVGQTPTIVLLRDGHELVRTRSDTLVYTYPRPGTYRVEVRVPLPRVVEGHRIVPVLYSGRIRILGEQDVEN